MDYTYLALKFLIGGGIIVGVTVIAQQIDPKYGGMLAAAPILTTLACLFTYSEAGQATVQQLVISAFWFAIPSLIFLLTLGTSWPATRSFPVSAERSGSGLLPLWL